MKISLIIIMMLFGFEIFSADSKVKEARPVISFCGSKKIPLPANHPIKCYSQRGTTYDDYDYNSTTHDLYRTCTGYYEIFSKSGKFHNSCYSIVDNAHD